MRFPIVDPLSNIAVRLVPLIMLLPLIELLVRLSVVLPLLVRDPVIASPPSSLILLVPLRLRFPVIWTFAPPF